MAGYLCWTEPGVFEPEDGHELHGDIEYFYRVKVKTGQWTVEVCQPFGDFWDAPSHSKLKRINKVVLKMKG